jgi:hypothetical protein
MSTENVEVIRGSLEGFNQSGDWESLYSVCDREVVFEFAPRSGRDSGVPRVAWSRRDAVGA